MPTLELTVLSLRYSSWSMRAFLPLHHAGADFETRAVELPLTRQGAQHDQDDQDRSSEGPEAVVAGLAAELERRRALGSVTGLFPVLRVDGQPIHEALAIAEWTAEAFPMARLWPQEGVRRAQARALACEMAAGFGQMRANLSCHLAGLVHGFSPDGPTRAEIGRLYELCDDCLQRSGGPFLFGGFGVVDAMYFPTLTRLTTYGIALPAGLQPYVTALEASPSVVALRGHARAAPVIPAYDDYIRGLGGDPNAWPSPMFVA